MDGKKKIFIAASAACVLCTVAFAVFAGRATEADPVDGRGSARAPIEENKGAVQDSANNEKEDKTAKKNADGEKNDGKERDVVKKKNSGKKKSGKKRSGDKKIAWAVPYSSSQKVKVLIMDEDFSGYYHEKIGISCGCGFAVSIDGAERTYGAGKRVVFRSGDKSLKGKKIVVTSLGNSRLKAMTFKRQGAHPLYRGALCVKWTKKGLLLMNEVSVEQYLYAVIPSEMPTKSPMEALKAQAVCARTYAYGQIGEGKYDEYGADLDDSASCQVYNNIPEDERSRRAVDSTRGKVITQSGDIITAYYFSTSWGCTADGKDVWNTENEISYLRGRLQTRDGVTPDLSSELAFRNFIDVDEYDTYDSGEAWYRWSVTLDAKNLSRRIDSALFRCYMDDKSHVLTQKKDGSYVSRPLKSMGRVKAIRVEKRAKSGLATEVAIIGSNNVVKVCTQYDIRRVLAPVDEKISRDGCEDASPSSLLPSAAFYVDPTGGGTGFKIVGGGFGHGAGLSQSGAAAMADGGSSYADIIKHYFAGTKIKNVS